MELEASLPPHNIFIPYRTEWISLFKPASSSFDCMGNDSEVKCISWQFNIANCINITYGFLCKAETLTNRKRTITEEEISLETITICSKTLTWCWGAQKYNMRCVRQINYLHCKACRISLSWQTWAYQTLLNKQICDLRVLQEIWS